MIECIPKHVGKSKCPECGETHRHYDFLPDSMLSVTQCKQIRNESDVDEIYPIFEVHDPEDGSFTSVPAVVVVEGDEFTVVYYDTTENEGWVTVYHIKAKNFVYNYVANVQEGLHKMALDERVIDGMDVVMRERKPLTY